MKSLREFIENINKKRVLEAIDSWQSVPNPFYLTLEEHIYNCLHYDDEINYDNQLKHIEEFNSNFIETINKCRRSEVKGLWNRLINESLKSFSASKFIDALYKKFPILNNDCVSYEIIDHSSSEDKSTAFRIIIEWEDSENKDKLKNFVEDNEDELIKLCKFYRYYISVNYPNFKDRKYAHVLFEPLDTEDITDEIKQHFNGKVYQVTNKKFINSIKKNGLLISSMINDNDYNNPKYYVNIKDIKERGKNIDVATTRGYLRISKNYRIFTDRTFVFYTDESDIVSAGKYVCKKLNKNPKDSVLIEINLDGHKNPFF